VLLQVHPAYRGALPNHADLFVWDPGALVLEELKTRTQSGKETPGARARAQSKNGFERENS
jgi:hypothetical protein